LSDGHGFTLVTGGAGSGKTTLIRALLNRITAEVRVGLIANTHASFGNLLQWICFAFGLPSAGRSEAEMYEQLARMFIDEYAAGRRAVLIIDEAQNLSTAALEELRVLSNINVDEHLVLQVILVGQPELRDKLRLEELRQFAQRIGAEHQLGLLNHREARSYVRHRLAIAGGSEALFSLQAIDLAVWETRGVPRLINQLCDTALAHGFADGTTYVGVALMQRAIRERCSAGVFPGRSRDRGQASAVS
jgi:type II secretory pathway predicted ATPase ExeA